MVLPLESDTYNLLTLQSLDFKELMRNHLLAALGCDSTSTQLYYNCGFQLECRKGCNF